jgi:hypothetical protein
MEPIRWSTLEFEQKDRHPDWPWYAGLVAVIVAILAFFFNNVFFGIFAIVSGATVIIYAFREPKNLDISIETDGIRVNENLMPYKEIKGFWLDESVKPDKLLLRVQNSFVPILSFNLEGVSAESIRTALLAKEVPETEMRDSRSIAFFDRLGF